jgi:hypothetical protein
VVAGPSPWKAGLTQSQHPFAYVEEARIGGKHEKTSDSV